MKISLNWLKKYIDIPDTVTPEQLARDITRCSAEVESIEKEGPLLDKVVVGTILKCTDHSNADSLKVCEVDVGQDVSYTIVCGGSNLKKGQRVAVALPGAYVQWHGEGDPVEVKKIKIRGIESNGMICASDEIGLADLYPASDQKHILDLDEYNIAASVGDSLRTVLGYTDTIFDIDNKTLSNRPDLWGHYGFAREVATIIDVPFKGMPIPDFDMGEEAIPVQIDNYTLCTRYMGVAMESVSIQESPAWLKHELEKIGIRPINTIVDITNYVMADLGQPLHAFDLDQINGSIHVRNAQDKEKVTLLDDSVIELDSEMLVIADDSQVLALAGIMGGLSSAVTDKTNRIFIECAHFDATNIRHTSTKVGVRSDSSSRFEKSLDPLALDRVLKHVVNLVKKVSPNAQVFSKVIDQKRELPEQINLFLHFDDVGRILGTDLIKPEFIEKTLLSLGFTIEKEDAGWKLGVPSWRATKDITIVEDVVEEILRIFGYDAIQAKSPNMPLEIPQRSIYRDTERKIKSLCSSRFGMNETYTYSFISKDLIEKCGDSTELFYELENPVAYTTPFLRRTLLQPLIETVYENLKHYNDVRIFEIGRVFDKEKEGQYHVSIDSKDLLPAQPYKCAGAISLENADTPFYDIKNVALGMLKQLHVPYILKVVEADGLMPWMHPMRTVEVWALNDFIGVITELHPSVAHTFGISQRVGLFEFDMKALIEHMEEASKYQQTSMYPEIKLDISCVIDAGVYWQDIVNVMKEKKADIIKSIKLIDIFEDDKYKAEGKKSLTLRVAYQSHERTLEQEEVQKIHDLLIEKLTNSFKAEIRK